MKFVGNLDFIIVKKVIGIVGMPGSGKSTALKIARMFGDVVVMGDVIREEAKKRGLEPTGENLGRIAKELREEFGPDIVARRTLEKVKESSSEVTFIDGLRSRYEVDLFKREIPLIVVAIRAPDNLRYKWLMARHRSDDSVDIEKLKERDRREIEFGIKDVIESADYLIDNDSTIEDLERKCEELFVKIMDND